MKDFCHRYPGHLKFWSFHCSLIALPSFLIAGIHLSYFESPSNVLAMLLGIGIFILGYSALNTICSQLEQKEEPLFKATHLALKIRMAISLLSLPAVLVTTKQEIIVLFLPDYWAGWVAAIALSFLESTTFLSMGSFYHTLIWTLLEGTVLSVLLVMIAFFSLFIISFRERKKFQKNISK